MSEAPVRILLVEDDEDDMVLTRQLLREIESPAFIIDWTEDFNVGLRKIREENHDVCLADYHLGAQNGVEFVRTAVEQGCTVPIILLTGQGDHAVDIAAMNAGAADFLNKRQLTASALERSIRYSIQQHRAEAQRIRLLREQAARAEAEAANRAKDQFLAVLSHELRTPLTAMLLTLTTLEMEAETTPKMRELATVIRRNADLEARLIDDLLDLTRIARGKLELRRELVDVHEQIGFAIRTCCGSDIDSKGLAVTVNAAARKHHVWGDPARLQQVLWNLIKNAAKFTAPGGTLDIQTSNEEGRIQISISDNGIGIAPEALPKIFNAFEQADRSITRQFGGLGLGLAICKALVELHGGRAKAASEGLGRGATFTIELPVVSADFTTRGTGDLPETLADPNRQPVHILLVEDHADTAAAMARLLSRRGYRVHIASRMVDALQIAAHTAFDILISDIGLPDGSGLELIRTLSQRRPVRGIALSGFGMDEDLERSRSAGFSEHLTKPIDFNRLEVVISRLISEPTPAAAPAEVAK
ncbi:MAG TPA: response regulator [Tepidisphaeraceae bacterium]|nr:response regulator [Tepidisphaeraceae bacterium]